MRLSSFVLALLTALAGTSPALPQAASESCDPAADTTMPPDAGPYMPDLQMQAPMPGQMKRDAMMVGDVAKSAEQKRKCMDEAMKLEEKVMDDRKH